MHTPNTRLRLVVWIAALAMITTTLWAQNPTGTLTGRVTDTDGGALPGVTVSVTSPNLQGTRTTATNANGDYKLAFLPSGNYEVTYQIDGFNTVRRGVKLSAATTTPSNVVMELGEISEEIVVTGQQALISETSTGSATLTGDELESLPVRRDLIGAVRLAPGVSDSGFRAGGPSVAGAPTYENLWMVNGVVVQDNIRNTVSNLFIEDAIQETTTTVSGVSAEFGRFTGGVINAVTKSGGNQFSGSLRVNYTNDDWEARTPLSSDPLDEINETYEATLGGFIMKDRLWFFTAGRDFSTSESRDTDVTNIPYEFGSAQTRIEGKLTLSPSTKHSIVLSHLDVEGESQNSDFGTILDLRSLNPQREDLQDTTAINYNGVLTSNFFIEGQYSERNNTLGIGSGGVPDLIDGTLIRTQGEGFRYWAPTFCGSCGDDEERNMEEYLVKGSYFLSTEATGTHDLVFGYNSFDDIRSVINHQTGSDFTVYGTDVVRDAAGNIVIDPTTGSPYPVFDPAASATFPRIRWFAIFNEDLAQPTSFVTDSFYVNDSWQLNDRLSFNVGARWDGNDGVDSAGTAVADDSKISPRLGVSWDVKGDGDLVLHANYGTYVAALANGVADDASAGGAVGSLRWIYRGDPLNANCTPGVDCLSADEVLRQVFDWYASLGGVFDLAQVDPNAPINEFQNENNVPGATATISGIKSPAVDEISFGVTKRLGTRGLVRADVVLREWQDFYGTRVTTETGQVDTSTGPADVSLIGNFDRDIERSYEGIHTQFRYRLTDKLTLAGNYTLSQAEGNFQGETSGSGPVTAGTESYAEYKDPRWNSPVGDLRVDQRHKARAWLVWDAIDTQRHKLTISWLENFSSGQPYGASEGIPIQAFVDNPGYADPPSTSEYWFTDRDAFHTDDVHRSDLSLNYSFNLPVAGRDVEFFIQPEVLNIWNEDAVVDPQGLDLSEGIRVLSAFDPFTTTPVEGVHWERRSTFGQPLNEADYQNPRTFRFSVGVRF